MEGRPTARVRQALHANRTRHEWRRRDGHQNVGFRHCHAGQHDHGLHQHRRGHALNPARTYGVGQAIKVHFDEPIRNKAAAERALSVTTVPPQVGGWNWFSDQDVHWRPKVYFTPHTRVTVTAKIYGVRSVRAFMAKRIPAPHSVSARPRSPRSTIPTRSSGPIGTAC